MEGAPEPDVFKDAQGLIGSSAFRIRDSQSYASAVYSGVFCLLALSDARDWRRKENIQLQELQDHHIFPQAYLRRHGITKQSVVNTIANRTLISDETNGRIKDKAPAAYLADTQIFPSGPADSLLGPHFIAGPARTLMDAAGEDISNDNLKELFQAFVEAREAAIVGEIRRVCGITEISGEVVDEWDDLGDDAMDPELGGAASPDPGFDWSRVAAAVEAIPAGRWTTYGELAVLGGTSPQAVGNRMASPAGGATAYRVLDRHRRVSPAFRWTDPADTRRPEAVLAAEGVGFDADGRATSDSRILAHELAQIMSDRFSAEELDVFRRRATTPRSESQLEDELPWIVDGEQWHLRRCSDGTRTILHDVVRLIGDSAQALDGPHWGQKYYLVWRLNGREWLRILPKQSLIWVRLRTCTDGAEAVAKELGAVHVGLGQSATRAAGSPLQVRSGINWPLSVMLRPENVTPDLLERLANIISSEVSRRGDSSDWALADTEAEDDLIHEHVLG